MKAIKNWAYLNNYFDFHVCLSICTCFHLSVFRPCVWNLTPLPTVLSQIVTNKSCLVCDKSEKCAFYVNFRPLGSMRRGQAEHIKTHFSASSPPQCQSRADACVKTLSVFNRLRYKSHKHRKSRFFFLYWPLYVSLTLCLFDCS